MVEKKCEEEFERFALEFPYLAMHVWGLKNGCGPPLAKAKALFLKDEKVTVERERPIFQVFER